MSKVIRTSTRNLHRDLTIVRAVASKQSFRSIGKALGLTGSRAHQLYKRTILDMYRRAGLPKPTPELRDAMRSHPVMVERVLETYARERDHGL